MMNDPKSWTRYLIALDIIRERGIDDQAGPESYAAAQAIKQECQDKKHDSHPNADAHWQTASQKFERAGSEYHGSKWGDFN